MSKKDIKKELEKQLQLLSELSDNKTLTIEQRISLAREITLISECLIKNALRLAV